MRLRELKLFAGLAHGRVGTESGPLDLRSHVYDHSIIPPSAPRGGKPPSNPSSNLAGLGIDLPEKE